MGYYSKQELQNVRKGLEFAKNNPDDPKSKDIQQRLRAGQLNFELKALGLKPVPIKQPKIDMAQAMSGQQEGLQTENALPESNLGENLKEGFQKLQQVGPERGAKSAERMKMMVNLKTFGQGGFGVLAQGLGAALDVAGIAATTAAKAVMTPEQEEQWKRGLENTIAKFPQLQSAGEAVMTAYEELKETDPDLARSIEDAGILAEFAGGTSKPVREGIEATVEAGKDSARITKEGVVDVSKQAAEFGVRQAGGLASKADEALAARALTKEAAKAQAEANLIRETIAPGLNAKEVRKAVEEGRATRGKESFFFGKKPDVVEVDDKIKEIANTVQQRIPGASTFDDFTLNSRIKSEIETIATDLEPKMLEVNLRDVTPSETPIVKAINEFNLGARKPTATLKEPTKVPLTPEQVDKALNALSPEDKASVISGARSLFGQGRDFESAKEIALNRFKQAQTKKVAEVVDIKETEKLADDFIEAFARGEIDADTVSFIRREYGDDVLDDPAALRDLYKRSQNPSMIDVAFNAWDRIKKRQQQSVEFTEFAGSKRFQEIFEGHLNKLRKGTKEKTLNDLWQIRKDYDNSISDRVKQANDASPISSQVQKEMWLENRRILNDIINDSARGLGTESQEAFKDMSNLYGARQNIIGKAKLDVKDEPGVIKRGIQTVTGKLVPFGIGGAIF